MHRGTTFEQPNPMLTGSVFFQPLSLRFISIGTPRIWCKGSRTSFMQNRASKNLVKPWNSGAVVALYIAFHTPPSQRS